MNSVALLLFACRITSLVLFCFDIFKVQNRVVHIFVSYVFYKTLGTYVYAQWIYVDVKIDLICDLHKLLLFINTHTYAFIQMHMPKHRGFHEHKHMCLHMHITIQLCTQNHTGTHTNTRNSFCTCISTDMHTYAHSHGHKYVYAPLHMCTYTA